MAVKDCDDRIDNRDTDLKDRAVKAFEDIASFLTLTGPFDLVLVQVLDHLRFTDKAKALASMQRVLRPGGRLCVLEFSKPIYQPLEKLYDFYSFKILPRMGELIARDRASYQYLAESIRMHPDQDTLKQMMEEAGFQRCEYFNLTGGIVALHKGLKA